MNKLLFLLPLLFLFCNTTPQCPTCTHTTDTLYIADDQPKQQRRGTFWLASNGLQFDVVNNEYVEIYKGDIYLNSQRQFVVQDEYGGILLADSLKIAPFSDYHLSENIGNPGDSYFLMCKNRINYCLLTIDSLKLNGVPGAYRDTVYLSYILNLNYNDMEF